MAGDADMASTIQWRLCFVPASNLSQDVDQECVQKYSFKLGTKSHSQN